MFRTNTLLTFDAHKSFLCLSLVTQLSLLQNDSFILATFESIFSYSSQVPSEQNREKTSCSPSSFLFCALDSPVRLTVCESLAQS